jgi:hypothetical protein
LSRAGAIAAPETLATRQWHPTRRSKSFRPLVVAEVQPAEGVSAEWIACVAMLAIRTQIETKFFRAAVIVIVFAAAGGFHLLNYLSDLLQMIRIEIFFLDFFRIEGRINFEFYNVSSVT